MQNLKFNDGFKTFMINDDPDKVIRINLTDFAMVRRAQEAITKLENLQADQTKTDLENHDILERQIREQIDFVFGVGTCATVFGDVDCTSVAGGKSIFLNFLEAVQPEIEKIFAEESKKFHKHVDKYKKQVMPE